jgi:hypothetical protein
MPGHVRSFRLPVLFSETGGGSFGVRIPDEISGFAGLRLSQYNGTL